jgi:septal ring factor EnvC (AmiA/AmiB activator)
MLKDRLNLILNLIFILIVFVCLSIPSKILAQTQVHAPAFDEENEKDHLEDDQIFLKYQAQYQAQIEKSIILRTIHQQIYQLIQAENQITKELKTLTENLKNTQSEIDEIESQILKLKTKISEQIIAYQGIKREKLWLHVFQKAEDLSRKEFYVSGYFEKSIALLKNLKDLQKTIKEKRRSLAKQFDLQKEKEKALEKEKQNLMEVRQKEIFLLKIKDPQNLMSNQYLPPMIGKWQVVSQKIDQEEIIQGISIQAQNQQNDVHAILEGQVLFAQSLKGLGFVVVLKHQDQFQSLYSGLSEVLVNKGEKVKIQEKLGMVKNGEFMYFELKKAWINIDPHRLLLELTEISQK